MTTDLDAEDVDESEEQLALIIESLYDSGVAIVAGADSLCVCAVYGRERLGCGVDCAGGSTRTGRGQGGLRAEEGVGCPEDAWRDLPWAVSSHVGKSARWWE